MLLDFSPEGYFKVQFLWSAFLDNISGIDCSGDRRGGFDLGDEVVEARWEVLGESGVYVGAQRGTNVNDGQLGGGVEMFEMQSCEGYADCACADDGYV